MVKSKFKILFEWKHSWNFRDNYVKCKINKGPLKNWHTSWVQNQMYLVFSQVVYIIEGIGLSDLVDFLNLGS